MAFKSTAAVNIKSSVTSGTTSSLNHSMFIDTNNYHKARITSFNSMDEVSADTAIPKDSNLYKALQNAFGNAGTRSLPIYTGRRDPSTTALLASGADGEVSFTLDIYNTTTGVKTQDTVKVSTTASTNTVDEIHTALVADAGTVGIQTTDATFDIATGSLVITPAADRQIVLKTFTSNLTLSYTSTELAATTFSEIQNENKTDWYYVTTSVRDTSWVIDLGTAVQATESSDYPKIMRVSSKAPSTLIAQTSPSAADDLMGLIEDAEFSNVFGEWHDQSEDIFPELASTVYYGSFFAGTQNWKFMNNCTNPVARHPVLGRELTSAEIGFITDRNAAVRAKEMGVSIYMVSDKGDAAKGSGAWMDNLTISHWIRLTQKLRIFNALVNAANGGIPLTFKTGHRLVIRDVAESVLTEAVDRNMLLGFEPVVVPTNISFENQALRTLADIKFTGYFAGKIDFVIVDGILTYQTGE